MTPKRETLIALRERVLAAKGADREIDARIWCALHPTQRVMLDGGSAGREKRPAVYGTIADLNIEGWDDYEGLAGAVGAEPVTASIATALAFVERAIPGVFYLFAKGRTRSDEPLYAFELLFSTDEKLGEAEHDDPCLAILAALLTALASHEADHVG